MAARSGAAGRPWRIGVVTLVAFLVVVAACNPAPAITPSLTTGIRGVVLAGPTCAVERAGQSPCVRALPSATIFALDSTGQEVGRAVSDARGAYFLPLSPGTYEIVPQAVQGLLGVAAKTSVIVPDGAPVQIDLEYDTGIR